MQSEHELKKADQALVQVACDHIKKRYRHGIVTIGAALRTKSRKIYTGINLKYRTGSVNACAETMALYQALDAGENQFDTLVGVKYSADSDSYEVVNACGLCRQLFVYNLPMKIIIDSGGKLEAKDAADIMPHAFI